MAFPGKIPLFPLYTVLFPSMVLPLHIFEERYKRMVYYCVTQNQPFGVVLIQQGPEVGAGATFFEVGTTAQITRVDPLGDGRLDISAVGEKRFIIRTLDTTSAPYLQAIVEDYPFAPTIPTNVTQQAEALLPVMQDYLDIITRFESSDFRIEAHLATNPEALAFLAATLLRISMRDKQQLLAIASLPKLMQRERMLLTRETEILRYLLQHIPGWVKESEIFSPN